MRENRKALDGKQKVGVQKLQKACICRSALPTCASAVCKDTFYFIW